MDKEKIKCKITVVFPERSAVPYNEVTVRDVAKTILEMKLTPKTEPLLIIIEGQKEQLYYNRHIFSLFASYRQNYLDLKKSCWCHGLYHNRATFYASIDEEIEAHSLWMLRHDKLILVDDNNFVEAPATDIEKLFTKVEANL